MRRNIFVFSLPLLFFILPAFAYAALVNINTADETTLEGLPGIGPTKAEAIINYRETNGPFATIADIENVSGIKSATFAEIEPFITVDDTDISNTDESNSSAASSTPADDSSIAASTTDETTTITNTTDQSSGGGPTEFLPIPTLRIVTAGDRTISSDADSVFTAVVYDGNGNRRDDAIVSWSFGDGMQKIGESVFHSYGDPGDYIAVAHATTADGGDVRAENVITVKDASIKIASVSARGIALTNNDTRTLDLSFWHLSEGGQEFKIPADTEILAGRTILFPSQVIELPTASSASLLYPNEEVADTYPKPSSSVQLSASNLSSNTIQAVDSPAMNKVEPIISTKANIQKNEEAVSAPAAAIPIAAAGAAMPLASSTYQKTATSTIAVLHSPWLFGFLGVVAAAGGAFVLL
jgi:competence ComEA-like helix-hairpin-helix protein